MFGGGNPETLTPGSARGARITLGGAPPSFARPRLTTLRSQGEFIPVGQPDLARPASRQYEKEKGKLGGKGNAALPDRIDRPRDSCMRQRLLVTMNLAILRLAAQMATPCWIVLMGSLRMAHFISAPMR